VEWPAKALASLLPFVGPVLYKGLKLAAGFAFWPLVYFVLLALAAKLVSEVRVTSWPAGGDETAGLLYDVAEIDDLRRREAAGWEAGKRSLWGYLAVYSSAYLPLLAGAYGAFALVKLNEKLGYLPLALGDPAGVRTYLAISELHLITAPESLLPLEWARWGAFGLIVAGAVLSVWSAGKIGAAAYGAGDPSARRGTLVFRVGLLGLGGLMAYCLRIWLFRG
jgi:hypothetical protein